MWNQVHDTLDYFPLSSPLFLTMTHITGFTTLNNSWCGLIVMTPFAKLRKCWAQREKTLAFLSCKVSSFPFTTPPRNSSATNQNKALQLVIGHLACTVYFMLHDERWCFGRSNRPNADTAEFCEKKLMIMQICMFTKNKLVSKNTHCWIAACLV